MQIEEGKFYRTASGLKVGPMEISVCRFLSPNLQMMREDGTRYTGGHNRQLYERNGDVFAAAPSEAGDRIVAEWTHLDDVEADEVKKYYADLAKKAADEHIAEKLKASWEDPGYGVLASVLADAYRQAAEGKGKERHSQDRPFDQQPIMTIGRMLSSACDGELYQAIKKAQEASGMIRREQFDAAERELLGGINYLAAAILLVREQKEVK